VVSIFAHSAKRYSPFFIYVCVLALIDPLSVVIDVYWAGSMTMAGGVATIPANPQIGGSNPEHCIFNYI
jgi:hypothetical protein